MKKYTAYYETLGERDLMTADGNTALIIYADNEEDAKQAACAELLREVCEYGDNVTVNNVSYNKFTANNQYYEIVEIVEV